MHCRAAIVAGRHSPVPSHHRPGSLSTSAASCSSEVASRSCLMPCCSTSASGDSAPPCCCCCCRIFCRLSARPGHRRTQGSDSRGTNPGWGGPVRLSVPRQWAQWTNCERRPVSCGPHSCHSVHTVAARASPLCRISGGCAPKLTSIASPQHSSCTREPLAAATSSHRLRPSPRTASYSCPLASGAPSNALTLLAAAFARTADAERRPAARAQQEGFCWRDCFRLRLFQVRCARPAQQRLTCCRQWLSLGASGWARALLAGPPQQCGAPAEAARGIAPEVARPQSTRHIFICRPMHCSRC